MISQIYRLSLWGEERLAQVDCKIYTDDVSQTIKDLHEFDFDVEGIKYISAHHIDRSDIEEIKEPYIGHINKAKYVYIDS